MCVVIVGCCICVCFVKLMISNWQFSYSVVYNRMQVCILIKVVAGRYGSNDFGWMDRYSRMIIIRDIEVITE